MVLTLLLVFVLTKLPIGELYANNEIEETNCIISVLIMCAVGFSKLYNREVLKT